MSAATATPGEFAIRRDLPTIGLVGLAHFTSHFLMLSLVPLLPLIRADFNVTFTELGIVLTVFFAISGVGQVVAGILVDRIGPHRILLMGVTLQAASVVAMGLVPSYPWLLLLGFTAGLGNCVYHPSDLSILSRRVRRKWQGRAFAAHVISGSLGFALSPVLVGLAATQWGWRVALIAAGTFGLMSAAGLVFGRRRLLADEVSPEAETDEERASEPAAQMPFRKIISLPVVIFGLGFFFLSTLSFQGVMTFSVSALTEGYGFALTLATLAAAALQFGAIGGTLFGGILADRVENNQQWIAIIGTIAAAAMMVPLVNTDLTHPAVIGMMFVVGLLFGTTLPSRDILIRRFAPRGNLGKTFGTIYSGLDAGSLAAPLLIAPMLDAGYPQMLFAFGAVAMILATFTVRGISSQRAAL